MGIIDYSLEPRSDIAFFDMKSFYASVECVARGLNPLTTCLCVLSNGDNVGSLILASSPVFKKVYGKNNVGRAFDLPFHLKTRKFSYANARKQGITVTPEYVAYIEKWARHTLIVPPRMSLYIEKNLDILKVLEKYAPHEEILPYSIDEGFVDLTRSLNYLVPDKEMTRKEKLDLVSARLQHDIWQATGVYTTVGMSNANPLLAKLALDNEAKKNHNMRANWSYEDVESKVWQIPEMTDFWGIGRRTEKRLNRLGIYSIKDLAQSNPDRLKKEFGVIGVQLWFHANGVDESNVLKVYQPKSKGLGNSQILPRNYYQQEDIELVLKEMAEQVAIRLRRAKKKAQRVSIYVGYADEVEKRGLQAQTTISPTQTTRELQKHVIHLFRQKYQGDPVRSIGVRYGQFVDERFTVYSLFDDIEAVEKEEKLDHTIDTIRQKHGFLAVQKASALKENSRVIARSKLVGGHSAGGLEGLS